ncbi:MAG: hypothetical protein ACE5G1_05575, partial [bacterium]
KLCLGKQCLPELSPGWQGITNKVVRMKHFWILCALGYFLFGSLLFGQTLLKRTGQVKYNSHQWYYINLGSKDGLKINDVLNVYRDNKLIGSLIVKHIAKSSASCILGNQTGIVKKGDRIEIFVSSFPDHPVIGPPHNEENRKVVPQSRFKPSKNVTLRKNSEQNKNTVRGRFSVQSLWFDDKTGADSDYQQFAFRSKLTVDKFLGLPLELRFRWRSRVNHRDRVFSSDISESEFTHDVYELGLVYQNPKSPYEFGLGRILAREIRGLGYIDGGLFSYKVNGNWRVGVAGGSQPGLRNSAFQTNEQKFGFFLNFERGNYQTQRISSTVAFSGSYHDGMNSREFVYLQNDLWVSRRFSVYQTVEVDFNRGWKRNYSNRNVQLSNFFISSRYSPVDFLSINVSYDTRKAVRVYETRSIPDSLFDETARQGFHSGITVRLSRRIRLSGNWGIRFRQGGLGNTTSASSALTVRQVFNTWATLNARLSYFSTMFSKGYRPYLSMRLPIKRGLAINVAAGSYIYQTSGQRTYDNWLEANGYYRINRRLFANFGYRMFIDNRLKSGRLFLESGVVF